jgi:xanthine dehydrogenase/oxidase
MLKHAHNDFPSDVFILLEAAGADVVLKAADGTETVAKPIDWLRTSMDKKILLKFVFPPRGSDYVFR